MVDGKGVRKFGSALDYVGFKQIISEISKNYKSTATNISMQRVDFNPKAISAHWAFIRDLRVGVSVWMKISLLLRA